MEFLEGSDSPLVDRVTGKVRSLNDKVPFLVDDATDVPADTKKVQLDVSGYKQSIENEKLQAEREVAQARAEHVSESSSTTREVKDNVESTTRVTKTRKVVQTVTAMKTRILCVGPVTPDMMTSIDEMFKNVPLLDSTSFSWSLEREDTGTIITRRVVRPAGLSDTTSCRSLIFIPRELIPYRQISVTNEDDVSQDKLKVINSSADDKSSQITGSSENELSSVVKAKDDFVLEIKRKEGLRTLWQETPPIKANRIAEKLTRAELDLQENLFEMLTSEASYGNSLYVVLRHLFNADCVASSEVVVCSDGDSTVQKAESASNLETAAPTTKPCISNVECKTDSIAAEFSRICKRLDRKTLILTLEDLHRNSVALLDALKKCWIADSCLMKANFVQLLADRLADPTFRGAYLYYLRDLRYQQELLRDLTQCNRAIADSAVPHGATSGAQQNDAAGAGAFESDDHLCVSDRYSRGDLQKIRSLFKEFQALKCVENRTLQSFLLLPLERLTKLKMCLASCEKLTCHLLGSRPSDNPNAQKESSPSALMELGVDVDETCRWLRVCLSNCCSLLDESNRLTYAYMQAEAQMQLDRLIRFEPAFGLRRISVVRTERLFLKDDSSTLLRFAGAPKVSGESRKNSKWTRGPASTSICAEALAIRIFLFSDLLLITVESNRTDLALAHFGLSPASHEVKTVSLMERLRRSFRKKRSATRAQNATSAGNGPAAGKFDCGTADLAYAIAGSGSITVIDYAVVSPRTVRVSLHDTRNAQATEIYPPNFNDKIEKKKPGPSTTPNPPRRAETKKLNRAYSTIPAVLDSLPETEAAAERRRKSEGVRCGKSLVHINGQMMEIDGVIRAYCDQISQTDSSTQTASDCSANLLHITLLENGIGERADYVFRFANEGDAPRWYDALAIAIANANAVGSRLHGNGNGTAVDNPATSNTAAANENGVESCKVTRPHYPSYSEELELAKGDVVAVLKRTADGWCKGKLLSGADPKRSGWFRSCCIE